MFKAESKRLLAEAQKRAKLKGDEITLGHRLQRWKRELQERQQELDQAKAVLGQATAEDVFGLHEAEIEVAQHEAELQRVRDQRKLIPN